ncbi:PUR family DNA/RNA-binding protein [Treponema parvum]|uniref:PUR family DNA/RNA-binding protein n=1 Tax=Treponema parvum TaxID=138851 RepID=UPI001AEC384C|nr:PUR family DNA/RNA-binding protein [Treponema parvum]QTQ16000.1 PUR family DNA/RNA-binding protein [Treponema parvum]
MGIRGELFTTQVILENRSYFFNVKENRTGDVFMQIVESKNRDGADFDRHQIAVFAEDLQKFLQGLDRSLSFIEKDRKERTKARAQKKAANDKKYDQGTGTVKKKVYRRKGEEIPKIKKDDGIKRTGRVIHVVSKIKPENG